MEEEKMVFKEEVGPYYWGGIGAGLSLFGIVLLFLTLFIKLFIPIIIMISLGLGCFIYSVYKIKIKEKKWLKKKNL